MLFNCDHPSVRKLTPEVVNTETDYAAVSKSEVVVFDDFYDASSPEGTS